MTALGGALLEVLDPIVLAAVAIALLGSLVPIHYAPSARLDRLERDYGIDRWSVWIGCVAVGCLCVVLLSHPSLADPTLSNRLYARYVGEAGMGALVTGLFFLGRAIAAIGPARRLDDLERTSIGDLPADRRTITDTDSDHTHEGNPESPAAHEGHEDRDGLVALSGEAVATDGTVEAMFSGTEALAYESTVFEPVDDYGESTVDPDEYDWNAVNLFSEWVPFAIDDGTGRVRVEPAGANLELRHLESVEVAGDQRAPERIERLFLETQALNGTTRHRRYEETGLVPGDRVTVVGRIEDGVVSATESSTFRRSPLFVVAAKSLTELEDDYRFRLANGGYGLVLTAVGIGVLFRAYGIL